MSRVIGAIIVGGLGILLGINAQRQAQLQKQLESQVMTLEQTTPISLEQPGLGAPITEEASQQTVGDLDLPADTGLGGTSWTKQETGTTEDLTPEPDELPELGFARPIVTVESDGDLVEQSNLEPEITVPIEDVLAPLKDLTDETDCI